MNKRYNIHCFLLLLMNIMLNKRIENVLISFASISPSIMFLMLSMITLLHKLR